MCRLGRGRPGTSKLAPFGWAGSVLLHKAGCHWGLQQHATGSRHLLQQHSNGLPRLLGRCAGITACHTRQTDTGSMAETQATSNSRLVAVPGAQKRTYPT